MKTRWISMLGTLLLLGAGAGRAYATGGECPPLPPRSAPVVFPPACIADDGNEGYRDGWEVAMYSVDAAWAAFGHDCRKRVMFEAAIQHILNNQILGGTDEYSLCRIGGFYDAVAQRTNHLMSECCEAPCAAQGEQMAAAASQFYCTIMDATDGAFNPADYSRPPVDACGHAFQLACDWEYVDLSFDDPVCRPYTAHPYSTWFYNYQHKACARHP